MRSAYHDLIVRAHNNSSMFRFIPAEGRDFLKDLVSSPIPEMDGVGSAAEASIPSADQLVDGILSRKRGRKQVLKASGEFEISEKVRECLEAIGTALVDDMTFDIRKVVAKDPRIQARCIKPRGQLEKEIIRKYQKEMSEKRKEKLGVQQFITLTALSGLSTKAYEAVRAGLQKLGMRGALPPVKLLREAKKELEAYSIEDLGVYQTPDGWFVSLRSAIENEILRHMQTVDGGKGNRKEAGGRVVGIEPEGHGWQKKFHIKIQLDARRITRRTSQTEVMVLLIPEGQEGVDRCQKAVFQRTIGVWFGKDSRDNVQANMAQFFKEVECLQQEGVVFSPDDGGTFLGVWHKAVYVDQLNEGLLAWSEQNLRRVKLDFWLGADMAAQCAVLGHGCAGDHYCGHCNAHKSQRHIPYELRRVVDEAVSFQQLADKYDMFPSTLYALNAGSKGGQTEHGLRSCTADAMFEEEVEVVEEEEVAAAAGGETSIAADGRLRRSGKTGRGQPRRRKILSTCKGPHVATLESLTGWKEEHQLDCPCVKCRVPTGTVVRVIPRHGDNDWRRSDWLGKVWPSYNQRRFPFCALHCLMRITEAMFMMITQRCLKNEHVIARLNAGLQQAGICKKFSKVPGASGLHTYEKLTFEGHQALKLLAKDDGGKMAVARILESMWPNKNGDADGEGGERYVPRVAALWEQWAKVVEIMKERDPAKVRNNIDVSGRDGFARFGKECREFCRQYQSMYHEQHCRSFYLHTLMHHAGDFMRELEDNGMCLGMMSNSGVERRHEYGRRAAKKALAGGCWKDKVPGLAEKENVFSFLTLKEILLWQHGTDLVSHERARRAAGLAGDADPVVSRTALHHDARCGGVDPSESGDSESDKDYAECSAALDADSEFSDQPASECTIEEVEFAGDLDGDKLPAGVHSKGGKLMYVPENDPALYKGRDSFWDVMEQESAAGSDEFEDEDAEEMARRLKDLEDLRGDWMSDSEVDGEKDDDFCPVAENDSGDDVAWVETEPIALTRVKRAKMAAVQATATPSAAGTASDGSRASPANAEAAAAQAGARPVRVWTWDVLSTKSVSDLKGLCRQHNITGFSKMPKDDLIQRLLRASEATSPPQR